MTPKKLTDSARNQVKGKQKLERHFEGQPRPFSAGAACVLVCSLLLTCPRGIVGEYQLRFDRSLRNACWSSFKVSAPSPLVSADLNKLSESAERCATWDLENSARDSSPLTSMSSAWKRFWKSFMACFLFAKGRLLWGLEQPMIIKVQSKSSSIFIIDLRC